MRALIAGEGVLPTLLFGAMTPKPMICALKGFEPDALLPDYVFRLETLGTLLRVMQERGVKEVCFAGRIRRPKIDPQRIDAATLPLVPVFQRALLSGDDGALRAVIGIFEEAGFTVCGAHELCPDLVLTESVPTEPQPSEAEQRDVARGVDVLRLLSSGDVGQACVVHNNQVLTIEGAFGTDWMLESLCQRPDGSGGVLIKGPKMGQDLRVDMPSIGPETVSRAKAAGLSGIAIAAGQVLVLERKEVLARCARDGLFLWSRAE